MINRNPDDVLLTIFSFLTNDEDIKAIRQTCKKWNTLAKQHPELLIKDEFKERFKESKLSAEEFYKQNVDARIYTYYVISEIPITLRHITNPPPPEQNKFFLELFPNKCIMFHSLEQAIQAANSDKIPKGTSYLIFSIHVTNPQAVQENVEKEISEKDYDMIFSIRYKARNIVSNKDEIKTITINKKTELLYYVVGSQENWSALRGTFNFENVILSSFPTDSSIKVFSSREEAIEYADLLTINNNESTNYIKSYPGIFSVNILPQQLNQTSITVQKTQYKPWEMPKKDFPCFEIPLSTVTYIKNLHFKTGVLKTDKQALHTKNVNQKREIELKSQDVSTHKKGSKCSIQ